MIIVGREGYVMLSRYVEMNGLLACVQYKIENERFSRGERDCRVRLLDALDAWFLAQKGIAVHEAERMESMTVRELFDRVQLLQGMWWEDYVRDRGTVC